jgi:hypothetical protein
MDNTDPHRNAHATMSDLVNDLHAMRNALVQVSLALQDYQFHMDDVQRHVAVEHANELIEKVVKPR